MPRHPSRYRDAIRHHLTFSPRACEALAIALEDVESLMHSWGLPVNQSGRIGAAKRHLRRVATNGSFGSSPATLHRTARAVALANDLYLITRALPGNHNLVLANELRPIIEGVLDESTSSRRGYQAQSQFWLGALLAYAEAYPRVPEAAHSRTPDFVVTIENVRLAVEVKTPQSLASLVRTVDSAEKQIRDSGIPGIVAIDLSDALGAYSLSNVAGGAREYIRASFEESATSVVSLIHSRQVRTDDSPHSRYERVVAALLYARFASWSAGEPRELDLGFFLRGQVFPAAAMGLYEHFSERLIDRLPSGIQRMTGNPMAEVSRHRSRRTV